MSTIPQAESLPQGEPGRTRDKEAVVARRGSLTALVVVVALAAIAATAFLPADGIVDRPLAMLTLLVLAAAVGSRAIHVPRLKIQITAGDTFMFCGMLIVGPLAGAVVAVTGILGAAFGKRRQQPMRFVYNVAVVGLAAALASGVYHAVSAIESLQNAAQGVGLLLAGAMFVLVNTTLVATALLLERGKPFFKVLQGFVPCAVNSTFTSLLVAVGLQSMFQTLGAPVFLTGLAASAMLGAAVQALRDPMKRGADATP